MSLKRLAVALSVATAVLVTTILVGRSLASTASGMSTMLPVVRGIERGAVLATFFLACFLIAQAVHEFRRRTR